MSTLFFGKGLVATSMARQLGGEQLCLAEEPTGLGLYEWRDSAWMQLKFHQGRNFESFDYSTLGYERVILSPGIDPRRLFFVGLKDKEVRELDLFSEKFKGQTIVITGTNGKSSFTYYLGQLFQHYFGKKKVFVGGNLGTACFDCFDRGGVEWAVLEVSSYQAERLKSAAFDFGVLLNLGVDHLDRYDTLEDYHQAKIDLMKHSKAIALGRTVQGWGLRPELILGDDLKNAATTFFKHFIDSQMSSDFNFQDLPHRQEKIIDGFGRCHINDSKATNVEASLYALRAFENQLSNAVVILGGRSKGDDFQILKGLLSKCARVLVYGEARHEIESALRGLNVSGYLSLASLLKNEKPRLAPSEFFLLSPACSSFDEFSNFEERGLFFKTSLVS